MLTPIDIQNHVLKSTMGGYNKKETDDFIESIQASYEQLYKENHDLKEKITALSEGLQYYKKMEGTLQKTLVLAEKTATETLEASRTKASRVERESQEKANAMLSSAKAKADAIVGESESKVNALLAKSQAKADSLLAESRTKADAAVAEAQKKADKLIANANERVERVLEDAKESADDLLNKTREATERSLNDANRQISDVSSIMRKLMGCYDQYKEQFKALLNRQLAQLDDPSFLIYVPDLESILESQQVTIAERQTSLLNKIDEIASKKEELNVSMKEAAPEIEKIDFSVGDDETPDFSVSDQENGFSTDINWEIQSIENTGDTSFGAGTEEYNAGMQDESLHFDTGYTTATESETGEQETAFMSGNESALSNADDGSKTEEIPRDNDAPDLEALAKLADAAVSAEPSLEASNNPKAHEPDFADIALEALRRANTEVIPKAPLSSDESSVLGTSYDDFVPASQNTSDAQSTSGTQNTSKAYSGTNADFAFVGEDANQNGQKTVPMPSFVTSLETPSYEEQQDQPFMPMPDFAKAMEAPSYEEQQNQPFTPMSDFAKAMEAPSYEEQQDQPFTPMSDSTNSMETPSFQEQPEQPSVPMPDFAKAMEMPSFDSSSEQPEVPMPDFARAAMDESSLGAAPEQGTGSPVQPVPMPNFVGNEAASFDTASEQPFMPTPDFARTMEAPSFDTAPEQPMTPMPDFSGTAAQGSSYSMEQPVNSDAYSDTALHAENYITAETYFGSADNIPYTGAAADFSNGITGGEQMESTPDGTTDLFSADFSGVAAAPSDEFAVSGSASNSGQGTPFTFIDANEVN